MAVEGLPESLLVLAIKALTRTFGAFTAVDALDLAVGNGELFGLLGANEAGRTTSKGPPTLLPPTGVAHKLITTILGHWKGGVLNEEGLFWENQEFMKEVGLGI